MTSFSFDNEVVTSFGWYGTLCVLKLIGMGFVTGWYRFHYDIFGNPEDAKYFGKNNKAQVHPEVERVRRAHLNDMENIFPFFLIGIFYVMTDPNPYYASLHFKAFLFARLSHVVSYLGKIPQPARAICHNVGIAIIFSMAYQVLAYIY